MRNNLRRGGTKGGRVALRLPVCHFASERALLTWLRAPATCSAACCGMRCTGCRSRASNTPANKKTENVEHNEPNKARRVRRVNSSMGVRCRNDGRGVRSAFDELVRRPSLLSSAFRVCVVCVCRDQCGAMCAVMCVCRNY